MPGPPTQKGKFKPRKPAKKIRAGTAAVVPDPAPSSSSTSAPPAASAAAASAGRGPGRGGREGRGGRDGRGRGRGRGRAPLPQGQVFFTAAPTPSKKPAKSSGSSSTGKASKSSQKGGDNEKSSSALLGKRKETEASEEVVGQLDTAIGSQLGKEEKKSALDNFDSDYQAPSKYDNEEQTGGTSRYFDDDGYTYDSDSSLEEAKPRAKSTNIPPTRLPFPVAPFPTGVGAKDKDSRPSMYDEQQPKSAEREEDQPIPIVRDAAAFERNQPSPFVDVNDVEALRSEMDSFFLFQFPTRLPALTQQVAGAGNGKANNSANTTTNNEDAKMEGNDDADDAKVVEQQSGPIPIQTSDVVTAPVKPGSFDNAMSGAVPGRLGKLLVYKSGKTVLVFQGPNGSPEIRMNVSEGLTCGFEQQAVMIDPDKGRYVKLGNVHKTAVVTPDLDEAFQE